MSALAAGESTRTTTAAVMTSVGGPLEIAELDLAEPGYGEVRIRILASGLCRSDLSTINGGWPMPLPAVVGHEGAGVIEAVGPGVDPSRAGQTVVLTFAPNCGRCRWCHEGRVNLCATGFAVFDQGSMADGTTRLRWRGQPVHHLQYLSTFAHHAVVPEAAAITVPASIDPTTLCLLGCGITTGLLSVTKRAAVRPGESVAIFGCGGVGLAAVMGAALVSAYPLIAVDPVPQKRDMARALGATHVIDPGAGDPVAQIRAIEPDGVDYAFEIIGRTAVARQAYDTIAVGGTLVCVGQPAIGVEYAFPAFDLAQYAPTILGSNMGGGSPAVDIPRLARLVEAGLLNIDQLITHRYRLEDINDAIGQLESGTSGRIVLDYRLPS